MLEIVPKYMVCKFSGGAGKFPTGGRAPPRRTVPRALAGYIPGLYAPCGQEKG